ncbi:glycogen synthase kinase-3 alpha, putative [Trypanosoma brucei brucei TREU927]|uniref:Glycogen synthase kinase-3 alpha, putative n=1 Tax=Trypanosoma brucei brucei (strain 927/4 GUTat10.1) TaxID=185431 RepID=Q57XN2_TRYB2|nr:glycogen synthase kinase-3 alpha, putative [Trypanosoma brucei brucei TREU927]AAX69635.1 glycogen synthase kinase-3 alpha, putative [Trypanosoma brucei]AAZ12306.1 glycogen synthase kinase-3 alpha, putative [Trypanosoma brucei brucei TREU927]
MSERILPSTLRGVTNGQKEVTASVGERVPLLPRRFSARPQGNQEAQERTAVKCEQVRYAIQEVIGRGAFGEVSSAEVVGTRDLVAIKRVIHDGRLRQRELTLMRDHLGPNTQQGGVSSLDVGNGVGAHATSVTGSNGEEANGTTAIDGLESWNMPTIVPYHPCVVKLLDHFFASDPSGVQYLFMVMDYIPLDVRRLHHMFLRQREQQMPIILVKVIMFQLARALAFLHARGICHRDVKPNNILVDQETGVVKLCDFGSAKKMQAVGGEGPREKNVPYIFSRYYRAPELLLGSQYYHFHVDMWAFGCVLAELLCGKVLFKGSSSTMDQLVEIIKVLGKPSERELFALNPQSAGSALIRTWGDSHNASQLSPTPSGPLPSSNSANADYMQRRSAPRVKSLLWVEVLPPNTSQAALSLIEQLLRYTPEERLTSAEVLEHVFFDELFSDDARLPNGAPLPASMFQVTREEAEILPPWLLERMAAAEGVAKGRELNQSATAPENAI